MWTVLFPGQGSQKVGMGRFYYDQFQTARRLFESASDELSLDFKKLCFEGPASELAKTQNTQPAILLVSTVAWACLSEEINVRFIKYSAGHSVGEYSALVASGVLSFTSALKAVRQRGIYMSDPSIKGGMSALIGPTAEEAKAFCKWVQKQSGHSSLWPANFNSPEQTVLSGSVLALKWAGQYLKQYPFATKKARLIPLKVSAPFHSLLMRPAQKKMARFLKTIPFKEPDKFVVQNSTAQPEINPKVLRKNLIEQVTAPVLWLDSINYLLKEGRSSFLELGEGKVLAGLMKKTDSVKTVLSFHSMKDLQKIRDLSP